VRILSFDIGIYCDGDEDRWIQAATVRNCEIQINRRGTGGGGSVRPTVNLNNARSVEITGNQLRTDGTGPVNNIYCIGSSELQIRDNRIIGGIGAKIDSNRIGAIRRLLIAGNQFENSAQAMQFHSDTNPIESMVIEDNVIQNSTGVDPGAAGTIVFNNYKKAPGDDFGQITVRNNTFRNLAAGAIVFATSKGVILRSVLLEGNRYTNWSTASPGSYSVIATQSSVEGGGLSLTARNEIAEGRGKGRAYMPPGNNLFGTSRFSNILERNVTNPDARPVNR
jgi:hypothetical protein